VFNKKTGKVLWETKLPAGGYATPCTYMIDGRQYIVIAAGGGKMEQKAESIYCFFIAAEKVKNDQKRCKLFLIDLLDIEMTLFSI